MTDADIRALEAEYDAAWNRGDIARIVGLYHSNAVVINPLGEVAVGRAAIQAALEGFLNGVARGSRHSTAVVSISYVREDVAVVDGEAQLQGVRNEALTPTMLHRFTDIVVREEGRWFLSHTRAYVYTTQRKTTS